MSRIEPYVKNRFRKLTDFDNIRKLKLLEIFQYNFFGFILVTIFAYFMNKHFFKKTYNYFLNKQKNKVNSYSVFTLLCVTTMLETFTIIISLFYIRKILLLLPSIGVKINKNFIPLSTIDTVVNITLSFLFIQFLSGYRGKMSLILDYEFENHF